LKRRPWDAANCHYMMLFTLSIGRRGVKLDTRLSG